MSTSSVLYKVRRILDDMGETFTAQVAADGVTTLFELPEDIIDPSTLVVNLQPAGGGAGTMLEQGTDYTLDAYNGTLRLTNPPALGEILNAVGTTYENWTDTDLLDYIATAFLMHTAGRNPVVYLDAVSGAIPPTNVIPPVEERAVALLAARLIVQDQATASAKDITIDTGDGTVIPRAQRYQQLVAESQRLDAEYMDMVEKLGLPGYDTIQVEVLRRVSMTTNRLVPVYVPREWDNPTYVQRVLPPIDTGLPSPGVGAVITFRGQYKPGVTYAQYDQVTEGSYYYLCINPAGSNVDPATDVAAGPDKIHGANWQITTVNSGMAGYYGGW